MVEKEKTAAPVSETIIRVLKETTLAELGIDTFFDNLGLASDRFTLGVKKVGEDTVFVGQLNHPFAGIHFAQFLNSVSPFGDQTRGGIIDDVQLPILARHDYAKGKNTETSNFIRLHERHLNDPRVGPPYIRFAEDHVNPWLMALEFTNGSQVFERLQRIRFINSTEDIRKELFSDEGNLIGSLNDSKVLSDMRITLRMSRKYRSRFKSEVVGPKGIINGTKEIVEAALKSLIKKEEQKKFVISYFLHPKRQILVDLEKHRIRSDKSDPYDRIGKGEVKFANNGRDVVISDKKGAKVVIGPTGQNSERFSWKAIKYQFPKGYIKLGLYPVVAWKRDANGKRSFLTQKEAMPLVEELDLPEGAQGDVKLGEIAVAYFARDITKNWPAKMTLAPLEGVKSSRGPDFEQPMSGGQMPAWVAIQQHIGQLLKSETSVLAVLEQYLA